MPARSMIGFAVTNKLNTEHRNQLASLSISGKMNPRASVPFVAFFAAMREILFARIRNRGRQGTGDFSSRGPKQRYQPSGGGG